MILIICSAACIAVFGACKVDIVGYHFHSGAVVAVLILILAGLKTAFNGNQTALLEILANKLGLLTPCNDIDEIGLTLLALTRKLRSQAMRKLHTLVPCGVVRSSGSATRRPMMATTFNILRSPFLSQKNYSS